MESMFTIFPILFGLIFFVVIVGMIANLAIFGTVFGLAIKRIREAADQQQALHAAQQSQPCGYCGTLFASGVPECPSCGGRR